MIIIGIYDWIFIANDRKLHHIHILQRSRGSLCRQLFPPFRNVRRVSDYPETRHTFYFLCSNDCDIVGICQSFDWYIVSKDAFNDRLIIGIGLSDKESINGELYRVEDETTLILWCDILRFTFESDFVRQFFPYNTHFKGKMRIDGALCFYIHDYYPTRCKDISVFDRKMSNLVFRFKEGRQAAFVAKIFSLCIAWMLFFKEKAANAVLIPIPAATRERNIARFARFCSFLSHRLKVVDGIRATRGWRALVSA